MNTNSTNTVDYDLSQYPLWTALVTPFDNNDNIDFNNLKILVQQQSSAGNGILLLGSTGEGLALTLEEQKKIVSFVCALSTNVPILVAVGGINLKAQQDWIQYCNKLPIHGYLLGSPLYAKPGTEGLIHWFNTLLDEASLPCMLYNVPGRSAVAIDPKVLSQLSNHPNLWALKEASGDINTFESFRKAAPKLQIYSGDDALMPYFAQAGAKGLVSVAANAWPEKTAEFVRQSLTGIYPNLFNHWSEAIEALFEVANPIPVKILMKEQGRLNHAHLRPPLTEKELLNTAALSAADKTISSWNNTL
ncbi:4-hydroxy-tetrahydrodipicolinate synthase [Pseudoalteromonas luteoviolacea]|uniref:4-hydroxy-tetrahydrodipicolinate synthase n=1 Tax=Pseudoalteromonas luteoviolacea TaxID=43657 RepID=UPI00115456DA|nr:4-hydroxy-tetrahydrodipicolinate synthase [Pseudoalteromonas luteoviolacea]TQF66197.1 4-hydroxy-tetrahydrodipicolinate synthase [Pseudoalteromonas luteoviolacea]